jgi:heterodisulfide reductase subunit A-like polyferredoxin
MIARQPPKKLRTWSEWVSARFCAISLYRFRPSDYQKALVIGGGIAGMQAALDIAEAGTGSTGEKEASIGGKMTQLDKTFPTMDCAA